MNGLLFDTYFSQKNKPDEKRAKWKEDIDGDFAASGAESSLSSNDPTSGTEGNDEKVNPLKWSVSITIILELCH